SRSADLSDPTSQRPLGLVRELVMSVALGSDIDQHELVFRFCHKLPPIRQGSSFMKRLIFNQGHRSAVLQLLRMTKFPRDLTPSFLKDPARNFCFRAATIVPGTSPSPCEINASLRLCFKKHRETALLRS